MTEHKTTQEQRPEPAQINGLPGENSPESSAPAWDGYPPDPDRPGYHWLRRTDAVSPMPAVIWTWRPEVQAWRWKGEEQLSPAEQATTKQYVAPVTPHDEVERLRAEAAALRAACSYMDEALSGLWVRGPERETSKTYLGAPDLAWHQLRKALGRQP